MRETARQKRASLAVGLAFVSARIAGELAWRVGCSGACAEDTMEAKLWLRMSACVLVVGAAYGCAAGEDTTDVAVSNDTTVPQCGSRKADPPTTLPSETTNGGTKAEQTLGNDPKAGTDKTKGGNTAVDNAPASDDPCSGNASSNPNGPAGTAGNNGNSSNTTAGANGGSSAPPPPTTSDTTSSSSSSGG